MLSGDFLSIPIVSNFQKKSPRAKFNENFFLEIREGGMKFEKDLY